VALERGGVASARVAVVRNGPPTRTVFDEADGRPGRLRASHLTFLGSMESQDGLDLLLALLHVLA
jgi:hypothetical protein